MGCIGGQGLEPHVSYVCACNMPAVCLPDPALRMWHWQQLGPSRYFVQQAIRSRLSHLASSSWEPGSIESIERQHLSSHLQPDALTRKSIKKTWEPHQYIIVKTYENGWSWTKGTPLELIMLIQRCFKLKAAPNRIFSSSKTWQTLANGMSFFKHVPRNRKTGLRQDCLEVNCRRFLAIWSPTSTQSIMDISQNKDVFGDFLEHDGTWASQKILFWSYLGCQRGPFDQQQYSFMCINARQHV